MSLLKGALTVRRFRVVGADPDGWRELYRARLTENAFIDSPVEPGKEEREGWVSVQNLLDADFADFDRWLVNDLILIALRVDKKVLPARLFKATLAQRVQKWCTDNDATRAPRAVRDELREALESEWLARALPRVSLCEVCINLTHRYAVIDTLSEGMADRVRKRVFRTFGFTLVPMSPLDFIQDPAQRERLLQLAPSTVADPDLGLEVAP